MINYIIQVILFQALFLAVYDFFLQKETFFKWNRVYLIVTPILSFLMPLLKFQSIQNNIRQENIVQLPEVLINPQEFIEQSTPMKASINYLPIVFYIGIGVFTILFLIRLFKIRALIRANKIVKQDNYKLVLLDKKQSAFSFFNYIFINTHLFEKKELEILQHEIVHCKQLHTLDLLLFELLKITMWFNPLVYVYQKRVTILHEYISDSEVVKQTNKNNYFNTLLAETFNVENISFINQFYKHSLIKKRIAMITKNKSQKMNQLKYLLIIPLLFGMLIYTSCTDDAKDELLEMESVLDKSTNETEGKYFDFSQGKTFIGKSLAGVEIPLKDYTDKEKEMHQKFGSIENSIFDYKVIIDENGERINFFKTNDKSVSYKEERAYVKGDDMPFARIENVPVYPGCEGTEEELRKCLSEKIDEYVRLNFNKEVAKGLGLEPGKKRIFVLFKIDKDGIVSTVKSRAPHKLLEEEAVRVVSGLPKMTPGKQQGENVGVKYSLPISFNVE